MFCFTAYSYFFRPRSQVNIISQYHIFLRESGEFIVFSLFYILHENFIPRLYRRIGLIIRQEPLFMFFVFNNIGPLTFQFLYNPCYIEIVFFGFQTSRLFSYPSAFLYETQQIAFLFFTDKYKVQSYLPNSRLKNDCFAFSLFLNLSTKSANSSSFSKESFLMFLKILSLPFISPK